MTREWMRRSIALLYVHLIAGSSLVTAVHGGEEAKHINLTWLRLGGPRGISAMIDLDSNLHRKDSRVRGSL